MLVSDFQHFIGLPEDAPGPALRMAEQLTALAKAGSAGPVGEAWVSALGCRRRPARRACPGRMVIIRAETSGPVRWECDSCGDQGIISGWEDTHADLRPAGLQALGPSRQLTVPGEALAAMRTVLVLDRESERLVFAARARPDKKGAVIDGDEDALEELAGCVAAEANHETDRRRQRLLDTAFGVFETAGLV